MSFRRYVRDDDICPDFRTLVIRQVQLSIKPEDSIGDVVRRFWLKFPCRICKKPGSCAHRDRVRDIRDLVG